VSTCCWPRHTHRLCSKKNWRSREDVIKMGMKKGRDTVQWIRMSQDKKTFRDFFNKAMNSLVA